VLAFSVLARGQLLARGAAAATSIGSRSSAVPPDKHGGSSSAHECKKESWVGTRQVAEPKTAVQWSARHVQRLGRLRQHREPCFCGASHSKEQDACGA